LLAVNSKSAGGLRDTIAEDNSSDIIMELTNAANMDWKYTPNPLKRGRDDVEASDSDLAPESDQPERLSSQQVVSTAASGLDIDALFALPMYTEDLGRLPIYEPLNWDTNYWGKDLQIGMPADNNIGSIAVPSESFTHSNGKTFSFGSMFS
jgi:hypothetical protein